MTFFCKKVFTIDTTLDRSLLFQPSAHSFLVYQLLRYMKELGR